MNSNFCLTYLDLVFTPILFIIILIVALLIRKRYIAPHLRVFFLPAIMLRFVGSTMMVMIYQFYYNGGDTVNYFKDSRIMSNAIMESPLNLFHFIFVDANEFNPAIVKYTNKLTFFI